MVVAIRTEPEFRAGTPQILFDGSFARSASGTYYDVSRDAQRFVMLSRDNVGGGDRHIVVVLNWLDELARLAPPDG